MKDETIPQGMLGKEKNIIHMYDWTIVYYDHEMKQQDSKIWCHSPTAGQAAVAFEAKPTNLFREILSITRIETNSDPK